MWKMGKENKSNDGSTKELNTLYRNKPEWKDVTPISQDDGPNPIVVIAYSDEFKDVFDYFRAVLVADEHTERALAVCTDAARLNPANYTVWQFRRKLLLALGKDLKDELKYIGSVIQESPKNYQVWQHRKWVVEKLGDPSEELSFIARVLEDDSKNYHAWQLRQWVLKTFDLWEEERDYVEKLLEDDILNNSAWNQRFYVIENTTGFGSEVLAREIPYVQTAIENYPFNESSWSYLRGLLQQQPNLYSYPGLMDFCQRLYDSGCRSPHLLAFMLDCWEEILEQDQGHHNMNKEQVLKQACQMTEALSNEHDKVRKSYWQFVYRSLLNKFDKYIHD